MWVSVPHLPQLATRLPSTISAEGRSEYPHQWHLGDVNSDGAVNSLEFSLYESHGNFYVQTSVPVKINIAPW